MLHEHTSLTLFALELARAHVTHHIELAREHTSLTTLSLHEHTSLTVCAVDVLYLKSVVDTDGRLVTACELNKEIQI